MQTCFAKSLQRMPEFSNMKEIMHTGFKLLGPWPNKPFIPMSV
jgi:hypothetical protein